MAKAQNDDPEPPVGYIPQSPIGPTEPAGQRGAPQPPQPAAASPARGPLRSARISLADRLVASGRHPVIIFGSRTSGKSTFLMSLVQCANRSDDVSLARGVPILDSGHADFASVNDAAARFLERDAEGFALGHRVPRTEFAKPFFIPVDVQRRDSSGAAKFALLEGRGESYEAGLERTDAPLFQDLPAEVRDVLARYGESLTIIYVAPFCIDGPGAESHLNDVSLFGAMKAYLRAREAKRHDNHLFLLTKWDMKERPMADAPGFSEVAGGDVDQVISQQYPRSWAEFCSLPLGARYRRYYMQYSSGFIVDEVVQVPPKRHLAAFDRYPRTVWNWLYANAMTSGAHEGPRGNGWRRPLFPEVRTGGGSLFTRWLSRAR